MRSVVSFPATHTFYNIKGVATPNLKVKSPCAIHHVDPSETLRISRDYLRQTAIFMDYNKGTLLLK